MTPDRITFNEANADALGFATEAAPDVYLVGELCLEWPGEDYSTHLYYWGA